MAERDLEISDTALRNSVVFKVVQALRQNRRHHLARHLRRQQPVAVLGEDRRHPDRVIDSQADEPAEKQIILHLLHQLPLGADREQDLDQAGPDQSLRGDRGAAKKSV